MNLGVCDRGQSEPHSARREKAREFGTASSQFNVPVKVKKPSIKVLGLDR
jgi:hypothetical protein